MTNEDLENKIKICTDEIEHMKSEIRYLKNDINTKEKRTFRK